MQQITVYRILTFILLPFAALFGIASLILLVAGLANPAILLPVFIMICFTIYAVCCFIFLTKGIDNGQQLKPSLIDWIKVNGYVSGVMGTMSLINSIGIFFYSKDKLTLLANELIANQPVKPQGMTIEAVVGIITIISWVMFFFSAILVVQLLINFALLKKYKHLFGGNQE
jgi:hypothetical protein